MAKKLLSHFSFVKLLIHLLICIFAYLLIFTLPVLAGNPASSHYTLQEYGFGNGGTDNTGSSSTHYGLYGIAGETEYGQPFSANYKSGNGLTYTLILNMPSAPTLSNPGNTYDRLKLVVNPGTNPSDTLFAVSVSTTSNFSSNVYYVKNDNTIGSTLATTDYRTYANWNSSSGIFIINLSPNTTYYVRARAKISGFQETAWGTISTGVATANSTLTFSVNSSSISFNALNAGNSYTDSSQSTVLTTTTNAYSGYVIYAKETQPLTSPGGTISDYGSPNSSPTSWSGTGFGYTTNDNNLVTGPGAGNRFASATKYAGFSQSTSTPGDPVADDLGPVQSSEISNEQFTISYRVTGNNTTPAGTYQNVIIYTIMATY